MNGGLQLGPGVTRGDDAGSVAGRAWLGFSAVFGLPGATDSDAGGLLVGCAGEATGAAPEGAAGGSSLLGPGASAPEAEGAGDADAAVPAAGSSAPRIANPARIPTPATTTSPASDATRAKTGTRRRRGAMSVLETGPAVDPGWYAGGAPTIMCGTAAVGAGA